MSSNESSLVPFDLDGSRIRVYTGEKGPYNLMPGSRKPAARRFTRWVTHAVLPPLHRPGRYRVVP